MALLHGDLHDSALHRGRHGVTGRGRTCGAATGAGLGLAADGPAGVRAAEGQVAGQGDLDATSVHLDDDLLALDGLVVVGRRTGGRPRLDRVVPLLLDPLGVDVEALAVADIRRVGDDVLVERQDRGHALDLVLGQGAGRAGERLVAVLAPHDQLGEHGVELAADGVTLLDARVHAHSGAGGLVVTGDGAGGGQEAATRVLAVDAELEGVATRGGVLGELEHLALGDLELLQDEVDARGLLGDRVLHLEAGVDLEEGDRVALDHVLDGAGAVVAGLLADGLGGVVDPLALVIGEERRGGLLDELLEAALQGAVAGAGDDDVAVLVGEDLGLDVAGLVEVLLDEALAAAERGDGLTGGRLEELGDLLHPVGDLHAATATTEGGLDRDGQAVLLGELHDLVGSRDGVLGTGGHRGVGPLGDVAGGDLVAEVPDGLRRGADPDQAGVDDGLREVGVLGEEAVAGVDGVGAGLGGGVEDLVEDQVRLRGGGSSESEGLVGQLDEQCVGVGLGVYGHAGQARVLRRTDHTDGDLAAVGDEDLGDVRAGMTGHSGPPGGKRLYCRSAVGPTEFFRSLMRGPPHVWCWGSKGWPAGAGQPGVGRPDLRSCSGRHVRGWGNPGGFTSGARVARRGGRSFRRPRGVAAAVAG